MSVAGHQTLRVLDGSYVLDRPADVTEVIPRADVLAVVFDEARDKLGKAQQSARSGISVPDESWKLGPYLEYWLEHVVKRNRRPATYALYEINTRLYLLPGLGTRQLSRLSVSAVQMFFNQRLELGDSVRKVQIMRTVLSAALTRAVREELIPRNVARLVELPQWQRGTIQPWTADEAKRPSGVTLAVDPQDRRQDRHPPRPRRPARRLPAMARQRPPAPRAGRRAGSPDPGHRRRRPAGQAPDPGPRRQEPANHRITLWLRHA